MKSDSSILRIIQRTLPYLLVITGIMVCFTFVWLGWYAHPAADDFCMVSGVEHEGLLTHLWNHYFEWSGRYSGNAFYAIYPLVFGMFDGLKFMPVLLLLSLFIACAFFLSRLFSLRLFANPILLVSLSFVSIYLLGMKHTASSLYWPAGALSYQTANILFLFLLGLIIQLMDRQRQQRNYGAVFVYLVLVIILGIGTNETAMLALTAIMSLAFIVHLRSGWIILKPWFLLLCVTACCFAIVYFSPGNTVRESTFPLRHDLIRAIKGSLDMGLWILLGWLFNPVFIVASLLTPFAVSRLNYLSKRNFSISKFQLASSIVITLTIPFVFQFPAWWAMGGWPPPRTVDAIFFIFLLSWFFMLGAISLRYMPQVLMYSDRPKHQTSSSIMLFAGAVLFLVTVLVNFKFQRAHNDLWKTAGPFNEYMIKRYTLINDAVDNKQYSVHVPAFNQAYPRSIYFNDIVPDSRDWRNVCYANYFGLQQISRERKRKTGFD